MYYFLSLGFFLSIVRSSMRDVDNQTTKDPEWRADIDFYPLTKPITTSILHYFEETRIVGFSHYGSYHLVIDRDFPTSLVHSQHTNVLISSAPHSFLYMPKFLERFWVRFLDAIFVRDFGYGNHAYDAI